MDYMQVGEEALSLAKVAFPIIMTTLLIFSRSIISMLYLGYLGKNELAGGSLALGFANITGLSVLKGLAMGMDPICGQAYGAKRWSVLGQTYQKTLCLLDPDISHVAKVYLTFSIPELIGQAVLHPMRSFLRTQGLTAPLTIAAVGALILHTPINYFLVIYLKMGVKGVGLALACNTLNLNLGLLIYVTVSKTPLKPWHGASALSIFHGWGPLLSLALPSVISVCLEWWWYEIMLFLCGLLRNPKASVAATGHPHSNSRYNLFVSIFPQHWCVYESWPCIGRWTAVSGAVDNHNRYLSRIHFRTLGICYHGCPENPSGGSSACGVLTGTARPKEGARINLCSFYFVGLPVAILLTFKCKIGFPGLWFGLLAAQVCCMCMMLYTVTRTDWKYQAIRAEELTAAVGDNDVLV
ncbi:MULTIDRUG RESISTANCE PROTEIN [Salix koriyanagi]|uniref:MULTIDRUG RESISTANCE PROTEIN n=1 Tax=Salix koriyanagi TaxID=2511006 RepID=A0A9Q0VEF4_9ROSI|nr:MULTIDRUG RESISTANCE PROTEIN [Salix koriyanagi]